MANGKALPLSIHLQVARQPWALSTSSFAKKRAPLCRVSIESIRDCTCSPIINHVEQIRVTGACFRFVRRPENLLDLLGMFSHTDTHPQWHPSLWEGRLASLPSAPTVFLSVRKKEAWR